MRMLSSSSTSTFTSHCPTWRDCEGIASPIRRTRLRRTQISSRQFVQQTIRATKRGPVSVSRPSPSMKSREDPSDPHQDQRERLSDRANAHTELNHTALARESLNRELRATSHNTSSTHASAAAWSEDAFVISNTKAALVTAARSGAAPQQRRHDGLLCRGRGGGGFECRRARGWA